MWIINNKVISFIEEHIKNFWWKRILKISHFVKKILFSWFIVYILENQVIQISINDKRIQRREVHQIYQIHFIWICLPFVNYSEIIYPNCENKINRYRGCLSDIVGTHTSKSGAILIENDFSFDTYLYFILFLPSFIPFISLFSICGIFYVWLFRSAFCNNSNIKIHFFLFILLFILKSINSR